MEVPWKVITIIMENRLGKAVEFHGVLHGFQSNRGTGTASLEAKTKEEFLYDIFLDLYKD